MARLLPRVSRFSASAAMGRSTPGPAANKKGEYIWRLDNDTTYTRTCRIEAALSGYSSTSVDISGLMGFVSKTVDLPPLLLSIRSDPRVINSTDTDVPGAAHAAWKLAMKAVESGNTAEVAKQLRLAVAAAPKFARGWHTSGLPMRTMRWSQKRRTPTCAPPTLTPGCWPRG